MIKYKKICIIVLVLVTAFAGILFIVQSDNNIKEVWDGTLVKRCEYFQLCKNAGGNL